MDLQYYKMLASDYSNKKVGFDPYYFRITRLSARKSEQMKNF